MIKCSFITQQTILDFNKRFNKWGIENIFTNSYINNFLHNFKHNKIITSICLKQ